jgi:hypothetical protein
MEVSYGDSLRSIQDTRASEPGATKEIFMSTAPKYQQALGFNVPGEFLIGLGTK